jgi:hypothetical protein
MGSTDKRDSYLPCNKFFRLRYSSLALATKENGPEIMACTTDRAYISSLWYISATDNNNKFKLSSAGNMNLSLSKEINRDEGSQLDLTVTK